jgi:hypothetical protein
MRFRNGAGQIAKINSTVLTAVMLLSATLLCLSYFASVLWRVSEAEIACFGRSNLLPSFLSQRDFDEPAVPQSFGSPTFTFHKDGKVVHVHYHLINGFQHGFGSALTAYEIGPTLSDFAFRINEYRDAYMSSHGRTLEHWYDTRKDLANNIAGREIGMRARQLGLHGVEAESYMMTETLKALDDGAVLEHPNSPKVQNLPTPDEYGCPWLPKPAVASRPGLKQM